MKEMNNERLICPGIYQDGASIRIDLSLYFSDSDAIPATVFAESVSGFNRMADQARDATMQLFRFSELTTPTRLRYTWKPSATEASSRISSFVFFWGPMKMLPVQQTPSMNVLESIG